MPTAVLTSFRLGAPDGVSVVARHWERALRHLGFATITVAGEGDADRIVPALAHDAPRPPDHHELAAAFAGADIVVVENLCTIPLNVPVSLRVADVLRGRPAVMHHHDPPWQRER